MSTGTEPPLAMWTYSQWAVSILLIWLAFLRLRLSSDRQWCLVNPTAGIQIFKLCTASGQTASSSCLFESLRRAPDTVHVWLSGLWSFFPFDTYILSRELTMANHQSLSLTWSVTSSVRLKDRGIFRKFMCMISNDIFKSEIGLAVCSWGGTLIDREEAAKWGNVSRSASEVEVWHFLSVVLSVIYVLCSLQCCILCHPHYSSEIPVFLICGAKLWVTSFLIPQIRI